MQVLEKLKVEPKTTQLLEGNTYSAGDHYISTDHVCGFSDDAANSVVFISSPRHPAQHVWAKSLVNLYCDVSELQILGHSFHEKPVAPVDVAKAIPRYKRQTEGGLKLTTQIRSINHLVGGWDGGDAEIPSPKAIENADYFSQLFDFSTTALPELRLSDDGEICFFWAYKNFNLDVGLVGDDTYYYHACTANGVEFTEPGRYYRTPLPVEILDYLRL